MLEGLSKFIISMIILYLMLILCTLPVNKHEEKQYETKSTQTEELGEIIKEPIQDTSESKTNQAQHEEERDVLSVYKPSPQKEISVTINGDVHTGDKYNFTQEAEKIDYSTTIIIATSIIVVPLFIIAMTVLILLHKKAVREHTEEILKANLPTYHEKEIDVLKSKYEGGE